ncbi:hypothetical protein BVX98_02105 [bacterium F11]|nr:hypothetical protein BVX98_02105 [bacterium F11]
MRQNDTALDAIGLFQEKINRAIEKKGNLKKLFHDIKHKFDDDAQAVLGVAEEFVENHVNIKAVKTNLLSIIKQELKPNSLSDWKIPAKRKRTLLAFRKHLLKNFLTESKPSLYNLSHSTVGQKAKIPRGTYLEFRNGLASVDVRGRYGYINKQRRIVIPLIFQFGMRFVDGVAAVKMKNQWGFINTKGETLVSPRYWDAIPWIKETYIVGIREKKKKKYALVDRNGKFVSPLRFDEIDPSTPTREAPTKVQIDGKWGFMDQNFKMVIPPRFSNCSFFERGQAWVEIRKKKKHITGTIDFKGRFIKEKT